MGHIWTHIARAALESIAYQTRDVPVAMEADAKVGLTDLRVDGGGVANHLLMQFQADVLGVLVICPYVVETTPLGAAQRVARRLAKSSGPGKGMGGGRGRSCVRRIGGIKDLL